MERLRRQWLNLYLLFVALTLIAAVALWLISETERTGTRGLPTLAPLLVSMTLFSGAMLFVRRSLSLNRPPMVDDRSPALYPTLGAANRVTIVRAYLFSLLAGVLAWPAPDHAMWTVSAGLYLSGVLLDYLDGVVARREQRVSELGKTLEGEFDSLGVMVAVAVLVVHEVLPVWYLTAGLIRYFFLLAGWWRRRRGRLLHPLIHTPSGKIIAGYVMVFLGAALLDTIPAAMKRTAGVPILLFLIGGFFRDWLAMVGILPLTGIFYRRLRRGFDHLFFRGLPLMTRWAPMTVLVTGLMGGIALALVPRLVWLVGSVAIAVGYRARTAAVLLLVLVAWQWEALGGWAGGLTLSLLHLSAAGAGWPSIHAPEPNWFARRD